MLFYDYEFETKKYQNMWRCITTNTFENMELYHRKQFSMNRLLSNFKKAFKIAPITLKNSIDSTYYKHKLLAIYLLTKYSSEEFETIAKEFNISVDTVMLIDANKTYAITFQDEIKLFFKQFENDYLMGKKSSLAFNESIELSISRQSNVEKDIILKITT